MAAETEQQETTQQGNGNGESNGGHRTAVRAAAIAAATGATAFAARKAFSGRDDSDGDDESKQRRSGRGKDDTTVTAMLTSGWDAAKDSLLPFAEDAADAAGEWVAKNTPEIVSDTLMPRFIKGFEKARKASDDESE